MNNDQAAGVAVLLVLAFVFLVVFGIWVSLIIFGIKEAKKKNRSPHWFWFGLHPVGALIVFIVMKCVAPLKLCPRCAQKSPAQAQVCPFCQTPFGAPASP